MGLARHWEDPYGFKPARFLGDWPRDAFLPFSAGARSCLGRKYVNSFTTRYTLHADLVIIIRFSETQAVAILSVLISRYKVSVKEEPQFAAETFEQRKARLLKAKGIISL